MKKEKPKIRIGVIGCGKASETLHLPALNRLGAVQVIAAADSNENRLRTVTERFSIPKRFTDYRELLEQDDVDAVAVFTSPGSHMEIGLCALESRKHLFIDKPLAIDVDECETLVQKASGAPVRTMLGFNFRWHRLLRSARDIVRSGALGEIKGIQSTYTHWHPGETAQVWHQKRELGGGVLLNDGVHHFDLWRFLLEREVTEIFSISSASEFFEDETSAVTARLEGGTLASSLFSFGSSPESSVEICGSLGRLVVSCYRFDGLEFFSNQTYPGSIAGRMRKAMNTLKELPESIPAILKGGDFLYTYLSQWRHFADCIITGREPECTFEDGKKAVRIACASVESVKSGKKIRLGPEHVKNDGGRRE